MTRQHNSPFAFRFLSRIALLFALSTLPFAALAQTATATLSGTVEDQNGAVVPGVTVTAVNTATALQRQTTTNDSGYYTIPLLPPGTYIVRIEKQGFMTAERRDVVLNVGDQKALTIQLKTGDINEVVNVTGEAPLISESSAVGTVVDRQFVQNIPLNGRSFQSLITLTPGVVLATGGLSQGQFSVNGQRSNSNSFMVDGVSANFGVAPNSGPASQTSGNLPAMTTFGTTQSLVSVDAMQEFKVQTSTYSAEYGRQPGGQVSIITRSGTNEFHGSLFDYLRNDKLDANDWFANRAGLSRPRERQNDFGGTLSGPLLLPRFGEGGHQPGYNGRNRTFFFLSYEGLQLRQPKFQLANVPSLTLRQNTPAALKPILNSFALPNGKDLGNGLAEFAASYSDPSSLSATSIRIDHKINQRWSVFGRYNCAPSRTAARSQGSPNRVTTTEVKTQTITLSLTTTITSRFINEFRSNYSDNDSTIRSKLDDFGGATPPSDNFLPSQFAVDSSTSNITFPFPGMTSTTAPGVGFIRGKGITTQRQLNIVDSVSFTSGPHQFKFGVDYRRLNPIFAINAYSLIVNFLSQQQVLNGTASAGSSSARVKALPIYVNFSAFAQDTWKLSSRLTLDLGLRWDVNPAPGEGTENHPLAVTSIDNLATMQLARLGTPLWRTTYNNFAPRVGVAYQLRQYSGRETVIRGGFGVYYDTGNYQGSTGFSFFPFVVTRTLSNISFPLSPTQVSPPSIPNLSSLIPPYGTTAIFDPHLKLPYTLQWSLSVEQSLGKDQVVTLSYVGAAGRRLLQQRQLRLNQINPNFTIVSLTTNNATSDYDGLQVQFKRRLSRGLQALVSYTWSHALDDDSSDLGSIIPVRGNATFDVRHIFSSAVTYDIPAPAQESVLNAFIGHWSVDTSIHAQTASPVDIVASNIVNPADGTLVGNRPNVIAGVSLYIKDPSVPGGRRINRAAFSVPSSGQFGNLGRNVVRALGAWQLDLALRRQFKLTERVRLQFRIEAFNVFNHPNFGTIQTTLGPDASPTVNFGQATNMLNNRLGGISPIYQFGGPRSVQAALKLEF